MLKTSLSRNRRILIGGNPLEVLLIEKDFVEVKYADEIFVLKKQIMKQVQEKVNLLFVGKRKGQAQIGIITTYKIERDNHVERT